MDVPWERCRAVEGANGYFGLPKLNGNKKQFNICCDIYRKGMKRVTNVHMFIATPLPLRVRRVLSKVYQWRARSQIYMQTNVGERLEQRTDNSLTLSKLQVLKDDINCLGRDDRGSGEE